MADHPGRPLVVSPPPPRPLVVFDGDCGFCRYWLARWRRVVGDRFDTEPYQTAAARFPALPRDRFRHAVQLVLPDGRVYQGAEAAYRLRALAPGRGGWLAAYQRLPGFRLLADVGYRLIADHRNAAFRATRWIWGRDPGEDRAARRLALPALAVAALALLGGLLAARRRR
jgi:predicted DCC family thiol-disulfide oxidoreductase YuxK